MIAVGQTYAIGRQRTYRQRKKAEKKPCMKNADALHVQSVIQDV